MGIRDWMIVTVYAGGLLGIGYVAHSRQDDTDEYFRSSRSLPWWAIGLSIIATSFSAASILGGPGEGYRHGLTYLQLQLGDLIGFGLVCFVFLPIYLRLNITSAYAYLERRFDLKTRFLGTFFFIAYVLIRLGGLLYGASLLIVHMTGWSVSAAIVIIGVFAILYTMAGGMSAVVWTDVLQFFTVVLGILLSLMYMDQLAGGGLGQLWTDARRAGRLQVFDVTWNPTNFRTLPSVVFGYSFMAFAVAGVIQQSVQRYVSCRDLRASVKATMFGWFSGFVSMGLTLLLGAGLYALYNHTGAELPPHVAGRPDRIFPYFIVQTLPDGGTGVLFVAVFAAAMSSIDSALHSLSTSVIVDVVRNTKISRWSISRCMRWVIGSREDDRRGAPTTEKKSGGPDPDSGTEREKRDMQLARRIVGEFGVLGIGCALIYVVHQDQTLLSMFVRLFALVLGPLLGLFLLGVLVPRATANGAFYGVLVSIGFMAILMGSWSSIRFVLRDVPYIGPFLQGFGPSLPTFWMPVIMIPVTMLLGLILSLTEPAPDRDQIAELIRF